MLERRLEGEHVAERALRDDALDREEVTVPPAIVKHHERTADGRRQRMQFSRLGDGGDERFVDDDRCAMVQCASREVEVRVRWARNDHEIEIDFLPEQLVEGRNNPSLGMICDRLSSPCGIRSHDRRDDEVIVSLQERAVENSAGQAVSNERRPYRAVSSRGIFAVHA